MTNIGELNVSNIQLTQLQVFIYTIYNDNKYTIFVIQYVILIPLANQNS